MREAGSGRRGVGLVIVARLSGTWFWVMKDRYGSRPGTKSPTSVLFAFFHLFILSTLMYVLTACCMSGPILGIGGEGV